MKKTKKAISLLLIASTALFGFSSAQADEHEAMTIAGIVDSTERFSILAFALDAAGLTGVLDGKRQFTVFAPNNEAFEATAAALETDVAGLVDFVVTNGLLEEVLLYHVAPGERLAEDVVPAERVRTMNKSFIFKESGSATLEGIGSVANIVDVDIDASNGVVHEIDFVLLPVVVGE
ncbi:MAG: fasciclin domain-containing protein [Puniceicoccaceae bacterium]